LKDKKILIGITGGIAAYKIPMLIRLLKQEGAMVRCIMSPKATDFVSPLVLSTLSENPVGIEFWNKQDGTWSNHVEYALWADLFLVAPCTANTLAKIAHGQADNLLLASYLSVKTKTMVAPAMDLDMYAHPSTKRNLEQIKKDGAIIIPAEFGFLASGLKGYGRMAEPETILQEVKNILSENNELKGQKILVTSGPTSEAIDPVRILTNRSSGKMGRAIAETLAKQGADVTFISSIISAENNYPNIRQIKITSACELFEEVQKHWPNMDAGIFAAAVADYRVQFPQQQKIKKTEEILTLNLIKNPDVLFWAGENKTPNQQLIGFALETNDAIEHAREKLIKKKLSFIVINTPIEGQSGFDSDTNKITILDDHNKLTHFELKTKQQVAEDIVTYYKNYKK